MGAIGTAVNTVNHKLRSLTDRALKIHSVDWTIDNVVAGLLRVLNEIVQDSVWREGIYAKYRQAGHTVHCAADALELDLETVDCLLKGLSVKYGSVTAAQGVAAGLAGAAGVVPDVVGLVALNLRAVGEYATYCGYDIRMESERLHAMQILYAALEPGAALTSADNEASRTVARQTTAGTLEQVAVSGSLMGMSWRLGSRLTKIKLAQIVPMAGAIVGGGFNAIYTRRVCEAAYHLHRERRLLEKYPPETILNTYRQLL